MTIVVFVAFGCPSHRTLFVRRKPGAGHQAVFVAGGAVGAFQFTSGVFGDVVMPVIGQKDDRIAALGQGLGKALQIQVGAAQHGNDFRR